MATESKSKYFHSLGELQADQEMEQALKEDDGSDWKKKQEEIEQAFKVLSDREEQKKKLKQRKDMSDGFRPKESDAIVDAPHYKDPRLEKPALQLPAFDKPQDYSIGKVPSLNSPDSEASNSFLLAGIHEWVKDGIEAGKQLGEVIISEDVWDRFGKPVDFNINTGFPNEQDRVDAKEDGWKQWLNLDSYGRGFGEDLETLKDTVMPWLALKDYLVDSATARIKAGLNPTQAEVDAQRTFKPTSQMEPRHKEALDRVVRETDFKDWKMSTKSKKEWNDNKKEGESFENYFKRIGKTPWYSLDLNKKITVNGIKHFKYADQWDKDPALFAMSKLVGKFNFQVNPNLLPDEGGNLTKSQIKYEDQYDFAGTDEDTYLKDLSDFFGLKSKGPVAEWDYSRTIPKKYQTKSPKKTET